MLIACFVRQHVGTGQLGVHQLLLPGNLGADDCGLNAHLCRQSGQF